MFWVILIVIFIIFAIAVGLGIDFWAALVGILVPLAVVAFLWATFDEKDKEIIKKQLKFKENIGKILAIEVAFVLVIVIISGLFGSCDVAFGDDGYDEYDDAMASQDWGDHYYYDSSDHEVKWKPWK